MNVISLMFLFLILLLVITSSGCSNKLLNTKNNFYIQKENQLFIGAENDTFAEDYYITYTNHGITISDISNNISFSICDDPNCKHNNENCGAIIKKGIYTSAIGIINKKLYFLDLDDIFTRTLYSSDSNGKNRKKICTIKNAHSIIGALYTSEYVYIASQILYDESQLTGVHHNNDKETTIITQIDLSTGKTKQLFQSEDYNGWINNMYLYNNTLYIVYFCYSNSSSDSNNTSLYAIQLNTANVRQIDTNLKNTNYTFSGQYFIIADNNDSTIKIYNLDTNLIESIVDNMPYINRVFTLDNSLIYYTEDNIYHQLDVFSKSINSLPIFPENSYIDRIIGETIYLTSFNNNSFHIKVIDKESLLNGNYENAVILK